MSKIGVFAIAVVFKDTALTSASMNAKPNKDLFRYSIYEQFVDIYPPLLRSNVMGMVIWTICFFIKNIILLLIVKIFVGVMVYIVEPKVFHLDSFEYIKFILK